MVIEREVKCYHSCATVVSHFVHLIVEGFGPILVYFCECCPAVKAYKVYQQTWLMLFDVCVI